MIDLMGFGIVLPLLPVYAEDYGASHVMIGLLFTAFSGMQFLCAPMWGRLSDRIGRRPVVLIGLCGSFASYALFAVAATQTSIALLFVSRVTAGLFGGTISTAYAYIADVTPPEERGRGMALIGMSFGLGFTIGPAIGGLGHALHPAGPGVFAAGFSLCALFFAWFRLPEPERHVAASRRSWLDLEAFRKAFSVLGVGRILFLGFLAVTCFALMESTVALLGRNHFQFTHVQVALLFTYLGFWTAFAQGMIVRRFMKRVGEHRFVLSGLALLGCGLLALGLIPEPGADPFWLLLIAPLPVIGFSMITPSLNSLLSRRTDRDVQGGVMGVNQSLQSLARIVGPLIGVPLLGIDAPLPFWVGCGLVVVGFLFAVGLVRKQNVADVT